MTQQEAIRLIVPPEEWHAFEAYLSKGNLNETRQKYLTWKHNVKVKEAAQAKKPVRKPLPIPVGKGKASDWRDVATGTKRVQ